MLLFLSCLLISFLSWYYTLSLGLSILIIPFPLFLIFSYFLKNFFQMEIASANDILCLHAENSDGNRSIIVGSVIYENKVDGLDFITKMKKRAFMHPYYEKLKKNVKFMNFGLFFIPYWQKYEKFDINDHFQLLSEKIATDQELYDKIADNLSFIDFEPFQPKWKIFVIENFKEDKSAILMKIHHCYADGISSLSYFMNLTDCSESEMVTLKKISRFQWIFAIILGSFTILKSYYSFLTWKKDINCFHTGKITGKKRLFSLEVCSLEELKKSARFYDTTINDTLTAILSTSLHKYCKEKYGDNVEEILCMIPVSLRPLPKPGEFYPIDNFCSLIYTKFPIKHEENVIEITKFYGKYMRNLRNSYEVYVTKLAFEVMPYILSPVLLKRIVRFIANKVSFVFSNVPGPKNMMVSFGKYRVERIISSVNIFADTLVVFSIITYNGKVGLTCISDKEISFCPKEFIEIFEEFLKKEILEKKEEKR